jgi:signal peptidase I
MSPSLERGKFVIVRSPKRLSRGDIVLFEHELASKRGRDISLLARVIGMPGESLKIEKGIVYINGNKLFEDYVSTENMTEDNVEEFIIPKGKYFLLCDNRKAGRFYDSRSIGPVGINSIRWKLR